MTQRRRQQQDRQDPEDRRPDTREDLEAEQSVLGSMLLDVEAVTLCAAQLQSTDFNRQAHRSIFAAIVALYKAGTGVDVITTSDELRRREQLEASGGTAYLTDLASNVPTTANVEYYASIVASRARLRGLLSLGQEITAMATEPGAAPDEVASRAEKMLQEARASGSWQSQAVWMGDVVGERWTELNTPDQDVRLAGLDTGLGALDELIGLRPGEMTVIAGRTSMGKSALAIHIAHHVAKTERVLMISLEMDRKSIADRLIAMTTGLRLDWIRRRIYPRQVLKPHEDQVREAMRLLWVVDRPRQTTDQVVAEAYRAKRNGCSLIVVDYLGLLADRPLYGEDRRETVSRMGRRLRDLARELSLPLILCAQLNRESEKRANHKPILADLAESGTVETDANIVLLLYRPGYYDRKADKDLAVVDVAKQRDGDVGPVEVRYETWCNRWGDLKEDAQQKLDGVGA